VLKNLFRRIPIFGRLIDVRIRDHTEAIKEVVPAIVLATLPIWFGAFILLTLQSKSTSFIPLMLENMRTGEFCLYAAATLAPLYYFIFKEYPGHSTSFPSGRSFMVLATIIVLGSSGLFAMQRAEALFDKQILDHNFIYGISWKAYLLAIVIVYMAHVYKNFLETGAASLAGTDTQDFVESFLAGEKDND
jgi:hypothetical protein